VGLGRRAAKRRQVEVVFPIDRIAGGDECRGTPLKRCGKNLPDQRHGLICTARFKILSNLQVAVIYSFGDAQGERKTGLAISDEIILIHPVDSV